MERTSLKRLYFSNALAAMIMAGTAHAVGFLHGIPLAYHD